MGACATKPKNVDVEKEEKDPAKKSGELTREPSGESYTPRPSLREIFQEYDERKDDKDDNNSVQENFHDAEESHEEKEPNPKDETVQKEQNPKPVSAEESKTGLTEESKPVSAEVSKPGSTEEFKPVLAEESQPVSTEESKPESEKKDGNGGLDKSFSFANLTEEKKKSESGANGVVIGEDGTGDDGKEKEASPVGEKTA